MRISQKYFAKRLHRNFSSCEFNEISVLEMLQTTSFCAIGSLLLAQSLFTPCAIVSEFLRNRLGLSAQSSRTFCAIIIASDFWDTAFVNPFGRKSLINVYNKLINCRLTHPKIIRTISKKHTYVFGKTYGRFSENIRTFLRELTYVLAGL
jgi:hypothetical protein